jgi:hypothetical protein
MCAVSAHMNSRPAAQLACGEHGMFAEMVQRHPNRTLAPGSDVDKNRYCQAAA